MDERTKRLISDAARAAEVFDEDDLEAHAEAMKEVTSKVVLSEALEAYVLYWGYHKGGPNVFSAAAFQMMLEAWEKINHRTSRIVPLGSAALVITTIEDSDNPNIEIKTIPSESGLDKKGVLADVVVKYAAECVEKKATEDDGCA